MSLLYKQNPKMYTIYCIHKQEEISMRVLIANDDGILAPGIRSLAKAAVKNGHSVTVYAPDSQRSAASHAISLTRKLCVVPVSDYMEGVHAYAVNGTPADCARLGLFLESENGRSVDFVLSGINNGANRGAAALYSGTVAAAMEASMCGIQSLAVSLCSHKDRDYETAAELGIRVMEWAVKHPLPYGDIYNLNVPEGTDITDIRPADLSKEYIFQPVFNKHEDGSYTFANGPDIFKHAPTSDTALTTAGYATVSVLTWNLFSSYPDLSDL